MIRYFRRGLFRCGNFILCFASAVFVVIFVLGAFFCVAEDSGRAASDSLSREEIRDRVTRGLYLFAERIELEERGLDEGLICDIFSDVVKDDPYLFFVSRDMSYIRDGEGNVIALIPEYTMSRAEALAAFLYCRERITEIAALADTTENERETAAFFHDYICSNFEYDESLESDSLYSFLRDGKGTCRAYSMLYSALLRERGINVTYAVCDEMKHMWNLAEIDGAWYHIDVTWDDSDGNRGGDTSRDYFMLTDEEIIGIGREKWRSGETTHRFGDG